jgi:hypothetical protein
MKRVLPYLLALAAAGFGAFTPAPQGSHATGVERAPPVIAWLKTQGFTTITRSAIAPRGRHLVHEMADARGCRLTVAALDLPEEQLPLLRRSLRPEVFLAWRLWLDGQMQDAVGPTTVNLRRIGLRLTGRPANAVGFIADPAHCRGKVGPSGAAG